MAAQQDEAKTQKYESFASVSSAIMMKIPTDNLSTLRSRFQENPNGLCLPDFLVAVISNMELLDFNDMMLMVADLIDFFHLVDINGDGYMEWEEFVMFILDCVVQEEERKKNEEYTHILTRQVQSAAVRNPVVSSMTVPALGKYLMGVGHDIQLYSPDEKCAPSFTSLCYTLHLVGSERPLSQYLPGEKMMSVLHMAYLDAGDILAVLRSDMQVEFFKFLSRSNYSVETIDHIGKTALSYPCHKICWRSAHNRPTRLFAIGTSNKIHHWLFVPIGNNGHAELTDHQELTRHTDYVRDILAVDTDVAKFLVSASLDKTVVLWDLASLDYVSVRTGHSAGVECLAFGGKSFLLAGGYDYSVIVWDLEAAINRPLFYLHGHSSCVTRIVASESLERCATLDERGTVRWWDISKNTPGATPTSRQIDSYDAPEDRLRTFDMLTNLPYNFNALHGAIFLGGGRRQHVFKLRDCSIQESAPVCTLYSHDLLSVYTIHTHDIIFWSAANAYQYKSINKLVGQHARVTCGILDDRGRRMILGDSNGVIRYMNCLNGVTLKTYPPFISPIKSIIYSPDKNVLVLAENSDIYILDDNADHTSPDYVLREMRIPRGSVCSDILCMAYSYALGLVVTVDCMGLLILWDYTYMTPMYIIPNASGNNSEIGRIDFIGSYPLLLVVDNSKHFSVISLETLASNQRMELWRLETHLSDNIEEEEDYEENGEHEDSDDEGGESGARAKPFQRHKAQLFLRRTAEVKRMVIHFEEYDEDDCDEDECSTVNSCPTEAKSAEESSRGSEVTSDFAAPKHNFPKNLIVRAVCGYGDGTMTITNLTSALRKINIGPIQPEDFVHEQLGYNPKLKSSRHLSDSDNRRILPPEEIARRERFHRATLEVVWRPHTGPLVSLSIVGEHDWILTASEDCSIQMWNIDARFCGLLTRGSAMDKLFRKAWRNPEDMQLRRMRRIAIAQRWVSDLNLDQVVTERRNSTDVVSAHSLQLKTVKEVKPPRPRTTLTDARDLEKLLKEEDPFGELSQSGSLMSEQMQQSMKKIKGFPDRTRVLCQLSGQMTYDPSKKDIARMQLQHSSTLPAIKNSSGRGKKLKRRRKKRSKVRMPSLTSSVENAEDRKYLETIKIADACLQKSSQQQSQKPISTEVGNWHYRSEMAAIEAQDPANWDITSDNRLRSMYENLHREIEKRGVVFDQSKIIESKIRHLCPDGKMEEYLEYLRNSQATRIAARRKRKRKGKDQAVASSAQVDIYQYQDGEVVAVSQQHITQSRSEEAILAASRVGVMEDDDVVANDDDFAGEDISDLTSVKDAASCDGRNDENTTPKIQTDPKPQAIKSAMKSKSGTIVTPSASREVDFAVAPDNEFPRADVKHDGEPDVTPSLDEEVRVSRVVTSYSNSPSRQMVTPSTSLDANMADAPPEQSPEQRGIENLSRSLSRVVMPQSLSHEATNPGSSRIPFSRSPSRQQSKTFNPTSPLNRELSKSRSTPFIRLNSQMSCGPDGAIETRAEAARRHTQELLEEFDRRMEKSETEFRKADRNRKRNSKRASARALRNAQKSIGNQATSLTVPKKDTFEEMLLLGQQQQRAESNWVRKVRQSLVGDKVDFDIMGISTKEKNEDKCVARKQTSVRLFQSHTTLNERTAEDKLRARQSFGPYKAAELLQFFEVFKSLPKRDLTGTDIVLTASTASRVEELKESPDGTTGCVALHDLLRHKYVRTRPHFKISLEKNLVSNKGGGIMHSTLFITLQRALMQMCPLMTATERKDCVKYFGLPRDETSADKVVVYSAREIKQLRQIFDYFDVDNSGTVDRNEIKNAINRDQIAAVTGSDNLRGSDYVIETGVDDDTIASMVDEGDADHNDELDFDEFVTLFGDTFRS